eukprot:9099322-Lingulodinium_polyedra.AAC.1
MDVVRCPVCRMGETGELASFACFHGLHGSYDRGCGAPCRRRRWNNGLGFSERAAERRVAPVAPAR